MKLRIAALFALLFSAIPAYAATATFWQFPDTGGLIGTEILPLSFPQGGGIYQTRKTTANSIASFVEADLLGKANTWPLGQIWSAQSTFNVAPIFASLTGYCQAHGAGVPITCAATIPMSAITGALPAAQVPVATASTLGGVETATAPTHQFMTGINSSGVPTFAQPGFADLTGTLAISALTGQILSAQIPTAVITPAMMAGLAANSLLGNNSGTTATPLPVTMSAALDMISTAPGTILYRGASAWQALAAGTSGYYMTQGASAPQWTPLPSLVYTLLATLTPSSVATITGLAAYSEYFITFNNIVVGGGAGNLDISYSTNNGSTYTALAINLSEAANNYGYMNLIGATGTSFAKVAGLLSTVSTHTVGTETVGYFALSGQINALKFTTTSSFSSGTIQIYGR